MIFEYDLKKNENNDSILLLGDLEKNKNPFISIVIPTYKRENLLKENIESILKQEEIDGCEIIICDNNEDLNDKKVKEILQSYSSQKIYYYKNKENLGVAGNWNRCIELARGKWITMIHDDDYLLEGAIKKIKKYIKKYDVDLFHFEFLIKNELIHEISILSETKNISYIQDYMFLVTPQILAPVGSTFKKECFMNIGNFSDKFYPSLDFEFWVRYLEKYKGLKIEGDPIAVYRISKNDSLNKKTKIGCYLKDFEIRNLLKNKYPIQHYFSYISEIDKLKNKKYEWLDILSKEEIEKIKKDIGVSKIDWIMLFILRRLRILYFWKKYQKNKVKKTSKNLQKI